MGDILIVDDEVKLRTLLARTLASAGHRPVTVPDGESACAHLDAHSTDLVLLDLVMPGMDGLSVLRHVALGESPSPVMVLSGVGDVGTRVQAINEGAVDFVTKPFVVAELVARVNRHLGGPRSVGAETGRFLETGSLRLDIRRRRLETPDGPRALSEREAAVFASLLRRRGDVCTREELLHDIWGYDFDPGSNVLEVCVGRLRGKIGDASVIETVRGVGYVVAAG
ncbi:response regulator transcription factor [Phycicoccus duodecadis]|uniref:DNA-binding response OmpR family regulator n=1 Tax=Phycicoccus duodecadis TaxID=173053 RepID=A0A2N3YH96_9MICO|nr:response regulator transcription factor [Phycicoccus duodecadis]PKW26210.1 DNA-binding response OmpR family regulator [Phycicoccus duodecadis]